MIGKVDLMSVNDDARKPWPHSESPRRPSGLQIGVSTQIDIVSDGMPQPPLIHLSEKEDKEKIKGLKGSKGRPTKRTSPQKVAPPGYMADTINSATKKSPRVARSSSVTHIPPEKKDSKGSKGMGKQEPLHAVSAAELRARLESLQAQKISTRLKIAEVLDVGSSSESSPISTKLHNRQPWHMCEGVAQLPGIARFYGDHVPFLAGGVVTFTAPLSPSSGAPAVAVTSIAPKCSSGPASPAANSSQGPSSSNSAPSAVPPPPPPVLSPAAAIANEADKYPIDKPTGPEAYIMELEEKIKSLQNAINVLHLERSTAQEKANILEAHCKRITCKWEADRNRMLELESKVSGSKSDGGEDGMDNRKSGVFGARPNEPSWDAMRLAELEHMRVENNRLRDENALLKRRIVSLNADIETQAHLVKQRTKSVVPELKVLRRRIADLEAENEELVALAKKSKPFDDLDVTSLIREHAELRAATNELLLQHDKVCSDYLALRDALGMAEMTSVDNENSPERLHGHGQMSFSDEYGGETDA